MTSTDKAIVAAKPVATTPSAPAVAAPVAAVTKTSAKAAVKTKTATKTAAKTKTKNKVAAVAKPSAKPAAKPAAKVVAKTVAKAVAKPAAAKPVKVKKPKIVRDSFTFPKAEYAVLDELKLRAAKLGHPSKKTELLRAGIKAIAAMQDAALLAALKAVPSLKTGRPANSK